MTIQGIFFATDEHGSTRMLYVVAPKIRVNPCKSVANISFCSQFRRVEEAERIHLRY